MDFKIIGDMMPVAICKLEKNEKLITESGSMAWMSANIKMETSGGGMGKVLGRLFSGESLFLNHYTAKGDAGEIALAPKVPGSIRSYEITPDKPLIVQRGGFLAGTKDIDLSMHFRKKLGTGFFGGEGFVMQKISGRGTALIEIDGSAVDYDLKAGQKIVVSTGNLAIMEETCKLEIQTVPGVKNILFGGEGLFNTVISGPGKVTLQTMSIPVLAEAIVPYIPVPSGN